MDTAQNGRQLFYVVLRCNNPKCKQSVFAKLTKHPNMNTQDTNDFVEYFPAGPPPLAHKALPNPVAEDWVDAQKDFTAGSMKSAAVMCRRVLYGVILDKKCKEHPLHEGIAQLVSLVRPPTIVEEWLTEIKEDGHDAAHPSRALDVPSENVVETMEYTKELLRFAHIEPYELKQRLSRKAAPAASAPTPAKP
jgi:hypothetical protein